MIPDDRWRGPLFWLSFEKWESNTPKALVWRRYYWRGHWTPFVFPTWKRKWL
jgi:hypothetical protein